MDAYTYGSVVYDAATHGDVGQVVTIGGLRGPLVAVTDPAKSVNATAHAVNAYVLSRTHGTVPPGGLAPGLANGGYPFDHSFARTGALVIPHKPDKRTLADELGVTQEVGWLPNKTAGLGSSQLVKLNHLTVQPAILLCTPLPDAGYSMVDSRHVAPASAGTAGDGWVQMKLRTDTETHAFDKDAVWNVWTKGAPWVPSQSIKVYSALDTTACAQKQRRAFARKVK